MSLPDISIENIRPVDGSRHHGFEEARTAPGPEHAKASYGGVAPASILGLSVVSFRPPYGPVGASGGSLFIVVL